MIFAAKKPAGPSSNQFLSTIKKRYKAAKAGYSGTLDPFASGVLLVALGGHTRLFRFLKKSPKTYLATIWLGASSRSLDNQNISQIIPPKHLPRIDEAQIGAWLEGLVGELEFIPPQFSAKKLGGVRAYKMAARGELVPLKPCKMRVYECELLHLTLPFLRVRVGLGEGGYVRSLADMMGERLGVPATLSSLERISEGGYFYENERPLALPEELDLRENFFTSPELAAKLESGQNIFLDELKIRDEGEYFVKFQSGQKADESGAGGGYFAVICVKNQAVRYELNKVEIC